MDKPLKPADLRAYAGRPWDLISREKLAFLEMRFKKGGPVAAHAAARRLFRRWRVLHPGHACPVRRAEDLAAHIALKHQFEQARNGFRGR